MLYDIFFNIYFYTFMLCWLSFYTALVCFFYLKINKTLNINIIVVTLYLWSQIEVLSNRLLFQISLKLFIYYYYDIKTS